MNDESWWIKAYVFGQAEPLPCTWGAGDVQLSAAMMLAWSSFAAGGDAPDPGWPLAGDTDSPSFRWQVNGTEGTESDGGSTAQKGGGVVESNWLSDECDLWDDVEAAMHSEEDG